MDKQTCMQYIYAAASLLAEENIQIEKARIIISKLINNDFSLKDSLNERIEFIGELQKVMVKYSSQFYDTDKSMILDSLIKEVYAYMNFLNTAYSYEYNYTVRESAKMQALLKDKLILIILTFIGGGKDLKSEYKAFRNDIAAYSSNLQIIADLADNQEEGLKEAISYRKEDAEKIKDKYAMFNITDIDLLSMVEYDILYRSSSNQESLSIAAS